MESRKFLSSIRVGVREYRKSVLAAVPTHHL